MLRDHVISISTISEIIHIIRKASCYSVWLLPYTQPSNLIVITYLLTNTLPCLTPGATPAILPSNSMNSPFLHSAHVRSCGVRLSVPDAYGCYSNQQGFHAVYSWRTVRSTQTLLSLFIPWWGWFCILALVNITTVNRSSESPLTYWSYSAPWGTFSILIYLWNWDSCRETHCAVTRHHCSLTAWGSFSGTVVAFFSSL